MGGYLTNAGALDRHRLQLLLDRVATLEQQTLEMRAQVINSFARAFAGERPDKCQVEIIGCLSTRPILAHYSQGLTTSMPPAAALHYGTAVRSRQGGCCVGVLHY